MRGSRFSGFMVHARSLDSIQVVSLDGTQGRSLPTFFIILLIPENISGTKKTQQESEIGPETGGLLLPAVVSLTMHTFTRASGSSNVDTTQPDYDGDGIAHNAEDTAEVRQVAVLDSFASCWDCAEGVANSISTVRWGRSGSDVPRSTVSCPRSRSRSLQGASSCRVEYPKAAAEPPSRVVPPAYRWM